MPAWVLRVDRPPAGCKHDRHKTVKYISDGPRDSCAVYLFHYDNRSAFIYKLQSRLFEKPKECSRQAIQLQAPFEDGEDVCHVGVSLFHHTTRHIGAVPEKI